MNIKLNFILLAAGSGQRFGYSKNKLLYIKQDRTLFSRLWHNLVSYADELSSPKEDKLKLSLSPVELKSKLCLAQNTQSFSLTQANASSTYQAAILEAYQKNVLKFSVNFILVCQESDAAMFTSDIKRNLPKLATVSLAKGANNREASMLSALKAYVNKQTKPIYTQATNLQPVDKELVFIHDAARLQVSPNLLDELLLTALLYGTAIPALPVTDTIVQLNNLSAPSAFAQTDFQNSYTSSQRLDRNSLLALQTPQVFTLANLQKLLAYLTQNKADTNLLSKYTDDSSLYEAFIGPVNYVYGDPNNSKLTVKEDLDKLKALS